MGLPRKWTPEERIKLEELSQKGYTHSKMGLILGRQKSSIQSELIKGRVNGNYSSQHSENNSMSRTAPAIIKKMQMIEIQLEILTDQIRIINERHIKNK